MKRFIVTTALALGLVVVPAQADAGTKGTAVVLGDSISDRDFFSARSGESRRDVWWSKLGRRANVKTYTYAERGSGYTHPGKCDYANGSTIAQRASKPRVAQRMQRARYVVIAAGFNDWRTCYTSENGQVRSRVSTDAEVVAGVEEAMSAIDSAVTNESKVIIAVPYGSMKHTRPYRARITRVLKAAAARHGFQYVDTAHGTLRSGRTTDGAHPNARGSKALYRTIWFKSNLHSKHR